VTVTGTDRQRFEVRDRAGFAAFYAGVFDEVYTYAFRLTGGDRAVAEDIVSDSFMRLLAEVDAGRVTDVGAGWLVVASRRRYIDLLRREAIASRLTPDRSTINPPASEGSAALDLLAHLPNDQRAVLVMRFVEGLSSAEAAAELGRSVDAVDSLVARAKRSVQELTRKASHRD
jgi:RNA polymerase sigma-70 factor, ECF subfamily